MNLFSPQKVKNQPKKIIDLLNHDEQTFRDTFLRLHPTDQLDTFYTLTSHQRKSVYSILSAEEFADLFEYMHETDRITFVTEEDLTYVLDVLQHMQTDDVADVLRDLDKTWQSSILSKMDPLTKEVISKLLTYPKDSAGSLMTTEFIAIQSSFSVEDVMQLLKEKSPDAETIYYLYVMNEQEKLVGVLSLRELIISDNHVLVDEIMSHTIASIDVLEDQEVVASAIKKYNLLAIPVTNEDAQLVGIITVDDVMDVIEEETTEDIGELAAVRGATDLNLSPVAAARKRAPWLILLMLLGLLTGGVINHFEQTLESVVILAMFIPMIMGSAGNIGTQSLAVVVRGLATGSIDRGSVFQLMRKQLGTGVITGLICGLVIALIITTLPFINGSWLLGFIVGTSICLSLSVTCVVGAVMPLIINKCKLDPALASGPFVTAIGDILSLFIYFYIATSLLEYL
ncbi:magnesium transporter [Alkalicoccobacillus murimartini]|uniref:Magnesium transporter MgtE n=1 Tax=Alkalicoccobacillus murimartini TaxID=171685 RepID=A0ABT9YLH2_9BACI|nr:magnesium transporter [Alkalicoccobacillus murimartini]MDQ0208729.1 magnesium transporter [Alkalicoccobacillus murimartini]